MVSQVMQDKTFKPLPAPKCAIKSKIIKSDFNLQQIQVGQQIHTDKCSRNLKDQSAGLPESAGKSDRATQNPNFERSGIQ